MRTRGRRVALAAVATGLLAVGGAAAVSRHRIREEYWILRLGHDLRAADALQLAAALVACGEKPERLPFVVLDEQLAEAAEKEGFVVIGPEG